MGLPEDPSCRSSEGSRTGETWRCWESGQPRQARKLCGLPAPGPVHLLHPAASELYPFVIDQLPRKEAVLSSVSRVSELWKLTEGSREPVSCRSLRGGWPCSSKVQDQSRVRRLQVLDLPRKTFKSWSESKASFILVEKKKEARARQAWGLLRKNRRHPSEWMWADSPARCARPQLVLGILCVWGGRVVSKLRGTKF